MKRILFVDDEPNLLDGMRRMLHSTRDRWELEFAESGEAALAACQAARDEDRSFDVVVSDLRMPGMDGAELLAQIKKRFPETARVVLSGYSDTELKARAASVAYRVLAKPCGMQELKETLERVCMLQDVLCTPGLRRVIGTLGELPSLSRTYEALNKALFEPSTTLATVAKIVEQDIAMSAKVLQLVNSGFFGLAFHVTDLEQAVNYLGFDAIRTLALYSDTFKVFIPGDGVPADFCEALQAHSQRAARIAGALPLSRADKEMAIIAALLHDIGSLVLAATMPTALCSVLTMMSELGISQAHAEEQVLGTSHAEIGAYLLGLWGIHHVVVEAIAHHHHPARVKHARLDCIGAVYLANLLARQLEQHPDDTDGEHLPASARLHLAGLGVQDQFVRLRSLAAEALQDSQSGLL
jgi:HD-like signal output (HDOD) protein